ncbi:N-acetyltransferase family protein [Streptomyces sp. 7R007]
MTTTTLRPATLDDVDALTDLHTRARTAYYRAGGHTAPDLTSPEARASRREAWLRALRSGDRTVLCAVETRALVGLISMGPPHDPDLNPATTGQLHQIHVSPSCWGRGIGSRLHASFVRFLRDTSRDTGVLEAWEGNSRARSFYARRGWRPDGRSRPGPGGVDYLRLRLTPSL